MKSIVFSIPEATPSNNEIMRMHYHKRHAEHDRLNWLVRSEAGKRETFETCVITVVRYASRFLDWDNMGGGLKFLLDALVKNKLIEDDNPNCVIKLNLEQIKTSKKDERTMVFIEAVN